MALAYSCLEGYAAPIEYFEWLVVDNASVVRLLERALLVGVVTSTVNVSDRDM